MNVKGELAKKRGVCPKCQGKFRIPENNQEFSLSLDDSLANTPKRIDREVLQSSGEYSLPISESSVESNSPSIVQPERVELDKPEAEQLYFVRPPSGGEYGPATKETIELWISQKRITAETMVCLIGSSKWKKAREVFVSHFLLG